MAYAENLSGPWKKDRRGQVFWGGHLAVFDGPDGRPWVSYRGEKILETHGLLCIDPFEMDASGVIRSQGPTLGTRATSLPAPGQETGASTQVGGYPPTPRS